LGSYSRPNGPKAVTWVTYSRDFAQWKWGVAGQNDDAAGRICFDLVAVEPITEADVENAGHDRVVGCLWDISFTPAGALTRSHRGLAPTVDLRARPIGPKAERRERLPVNVFRQDGSENGFAWLMCVLRCGGSHGSVAIGVAQQCNRDYD
jgi:hypothetical protein